MTRHGTPIMRTDWWSYEFCGGWSSVAERVARCRMGSAKRAGAAARWSAGIRTPVSTQTAQQKQSSACVSSVPLGDVAPPIPGVAAVLAAPSRQQSAYVRSTAVHARRTLAMTRTTGARDRSTSVV